MSSQGRSAELAVVGMALNVPGAASLESFWDNLCAGVVSIARFSTAELAAAGVPAKIHRHPRYVPAKAIVEGSEHFDAGFFGYTPSEAAVLDPQQRMFLELCWLALEDANCDPERFGGRIGVFGSSSLSQYLLNNLFGHQELLESIGEYRLLLANDKDFLASRVAHKFDLSGPAYTVQSACSSSLLAVHVACQNLLSGECDLALAGGVALTFPQKAGYIYQEGMISSPDGACRPFEARARGTVRGEGAAVVAIRPLADALSDGDCIHAVIQGSAVNNDGARKIGFTAPSVTRQAAVIREAMEMASFPPESVGFVETHGTGTALGDPVELAALREAFDGRAASAPRCYLGTLKANIGHLDAAAGIVGLVKSCLVLERGLIPPAAGFRDPHPALKLTASPFLIDSELRRWPAHFALRRAGVSSFGVGGTNVHVALEQAPARAAARKIDPVPLIVPFSADSMEALRARVSDMALHIAAHPEESLRELAWSLQRGRKQMRYRVALICRTLRELHDRLRELSAELATRELQTLSPGISPPSVDLAPSPGAALSPADLWKLAEAWQQGGSVSWEALWPEGVPARTRLPGYRFERTRCWIDPPSADSGPPERQVPQTRRERASTSAETIRRLWAEVLGKEQLGLHENVFDAGADSLHVLRFLDLLTERTGAHLSANVLFESFTAASLSERLGRAEGESGRAPLERAAAERLGAQQPEPEAGDIIL